MSRWVAIEIVACVRKSVVKVSHSSPQPDCPRGLDSARQLGRAWRKKLPSARARSKTSKFLMIFEDSCANVVMTALSTTRSIFAILFEFATVLRGAALDLRRVVVRFSCLGLKNQPSSENRS